MAISARQRSGIRGVSKLRRTLRRIEPEATRELREAIDKGATHVLADMQSMVPKDSGDTAAALEKRISRDGFTAEVGLVTPRAAREGFVARFIEFGTKGYPKRNIPPQPARPFMSPAFLVNEDMIRHETRAAIRLAMARASAGGGENAP